MAVHVPPRVLSSLAGLTNAADLGRLLGSGVRNLRIDPLRGIGYSSASLSRLEVDTSDGGHRSLILKRTLLGEDWTARRTDDARGREGLLVNEPALAAVWRIFDCPYVAVAVEPGEVGLLLRDLTGELLPDERAPLTDAQEDALLGALARLHARFWNGDLAATDWLVNPAGYCELLAPSITGDPTALSMLPATMRDAVPRGWASALARLPATVARHLTRPGSDWVRDWADLPWTLLHGDVKVANFALASDGRVAAFDWALVGSGPCAIDLGWYLAVNATRLTASKESVQRRYRALLENALGGPLPDALWRRLEDVAVLCGARMLLWSKALALDHGRPGAEEEWNWWARGLAELGTGRTTV